MNRVSSQVSVGVDVTGIDVSSTVRLSFEVLNFFEFWVFLQVIKDS